MIFLLSFISSLFFFFLFFLTTLKAADLLSTKNCDQLLSPEDRFGLLGFPVAHSLSPRMHHAAFGAAHLPYCYLPIEVRPEELEQTLQKLLALGFLGLNITTPYKKAVIPYLDEVSHHAQFLGAVNTILMTEGRLLGYNTDGPGLVMALKETWNLPLPAQRILILGASGGAGGAMAAQSILEGCCKLILASRTPATLEPQVRALSEYVAEAISIEAVELSEQALSMVMPHVDLIINATPPSATSNDAPLIPSYLFHKNHYFYDMVYSSSRTALMKSAMNAGAQVSNGLSMLLYQGALAFQQWLDRPPPLEAMKKALTDASLT